MPKPDTHPNVEVAPFRSPAFWNRDVRFFANLQSLFLGNSEQTEELSALVGEIDSYGGRLAPVLNLIYRGGPNTLFLERSPDAALMAYFSDALGLQLPRIELLPYDAYRSAENAADTLAARSLPPNDWIDGYVTDELLLAWAKASQSRPVSSVEGCSLGNNKTRLFQFLQANGFPTPDTHLADTPEAILAGFRQLRKDGYRNAVARAAIGASGIGMIKTGLDDLDRLEVPKQFFHGGPCLVQGWLEDGVKETTAVSSPSVQLFVDDPSVHLFDITDQILSQESVHEGNHSPPRSGNADTRSELLRQAAAAATWLHQQGYRGTASVDFLVVETSARPQPDVYVCEINARITGATYPSVLGRHLLPGGAWLLRNLRLEHPVAGEKLLAHIDDARHLFRPEQTEGIVPLNFNFDPSGYARKGQFLCLAPTVDRASRLLESLVEGLPFKTQIERD